MNFAEKGSLSHLVLPVVGEVVLAAEVEPEKRVEASSRRRVLFGTVTWKSVLKTP